MLVAIPFKRRGVIKESTALAKAARRRTEGTRQVLANRKKPDEHAAERKTIK